MTEWDNVLRIVTDARVRPWLAFVGLIEWRPSPYCPEGQIYATSSVRITSLYTNSIMMSVPPSVICTPLDHQMLLADATRNGITSSQEAAAMFWWSVMESNGRIPGRGLPPVPPAPPSSLAP